MQRVVHVGCEIEHRDSPSLLTWCRRRIVFPYREDNSAPARKRNRVEVTNLTLRVIDIRERFRPASGGGYAHQTPGGTGHN